ncbi:MAG: NUDIX hydrolase, partial [Pseudomonadota bacterium]
EYERHYPAEKETLQRFRAFVAEHKRCFERDCWAGHVTGSAWVVDPARQDVLLTHHKKLDIWVQLGGHSDGDADTPAVALREAQEESGLPVQFDGDTATPPVFDLDIHAIPARKGDPEHFHFDVRFVFVAAHREFQVSEESNALAWVPIADLAQYTSEQSMLRMRDKWLLSH